MSLRLSAVTRRSLERPRRFCTTSRTSGRFSPTVPLIWLATRARSAPQRPAGASLQGTPAQLLTDRADLEQVIARGRNVMAGYWQDPDATAVPPDQFIPIPFQTVAGSAGFRIAIFDEGPTPDQPGTNGIDADAFLAEFAGEARHLGHEPVVVGQQVV